MTNQTNQQWQPIETVPNNVCIDVWVVSDGNPDYGHRITDVHYSDGRWFGVDLRWHYPKFWMHIPARPQGST